jgi:hypothetical protein
MPESSHWFYAGPYVPSGVVYDPDRKISDKPSPSYSVWLVPGYERAFEAVGVIDLYDPPEWFR